MKHLFITACMALMLAGCAQAEAPAPTDMTPQPAVTSSTVQQALAGSGLHIVGTLEAPAGYHGFVGQYQGRKLPVYVMPDGKHLTVGTLYDMDGHDLTTAAMHRAADASFGEAQWKALEKATWVAEGDADAKRVVYVFTDTECPYCQRFWKASQPWIAKGGVQVRNILVAVISPDSLPHAAAILEADDPARAWQKNEKHFGKGGAASGGKPSPASRQKIQANNALMMQVGFFGTPGVVYKDSEGRIHTLHGLPPDRERLKAVFEG